MSPEVNKMNVTSTCYVFLKCSRNLDIKDYVFMCEYMIDGIISIAQKVLNLNSGANCFTLLIMRGKDVSLDFLLEKGRRECEELGHSLGEI